ncbi:transglutaminase family protein [Rhizobium sp. BK379]|jgi:transglutaminase-like putative cysteine protease|uniref:transglutaminase family protein n=1 Tax=Rhizobium sp. BK379 TaxID=2587059 RepID=UPI000DD7F336|nr:transglutaminase family protein [Rhizobium sp. BK379]MBB3444432.1 transglutaminase-like putative cysteine protease [Rhizobium sp. BK379]
MPKLSICHRTTYSYRSPVQLSPYRLLLRPREGPEILLLSHDIAFSPEGRVSWTTDVFGNAIATVTFSEATQRLEITSRADVDLTSEAWPVFDIAASAATYPFRYDDQDWKDLGALRDVQYSDPSGEFHQWVRGFVMAEPTDTLSLLKDLSAGVSNGVAYQARDTEGTQPPLQTLGLRSGSCRDLAMVLVESVRVLGIGARIVSGYLYDPAFTLIGSSPGGSTHAWVEVFLPGAGWVAFDPTNRSMGSANLIPVAVARDIIQLFPVSGTFIGSADAFMSMDVAVDISFTA